MAASVEAKDRRVRSRQGRRCEATMVVKSTVLQKRLAGWLGMGYLKGTYHIQAKVHMQGHLYFRVRSLGY